MAGEALTNAFTLGSATVMIGPPSMLYDLTTANSIGLVKNFTISTTPTFLDLTQGAKGQIVYTSMTSNPAKASMEVFEYTAANLAYGLGLDGSTLAAAGASYPTTAVLTGSATPVTTATFTSATDVTALFPIGTWVSIQGALTDSVHYAKLTATTTVTGTAPNMIHTITFTGQGLKLNNNFPLGSKVTLVNRLDIGSTVDQPYHAAKIVAVLPDGSKPMGILIPKMRITKGFTAAFSDSNYGNMPFEFEPLAPVTTDPFYADFLGKGVASLMAQS